MAAIHFTTIPCEPNRAINIHRKPHFGEIHPCTNKIVYARFDVFEPRGSLCCVFGQDTFTLTVPLKWVPANCQGNLTKSWGVTCDGLASHPGGVAIFLFAQCYGNRDNLRLRGPPLGSCVDFTLPYLIIYR